MKKLTSTRVIEPSTSSPTHPSREMRVPRCSGRVVIQPNYYLGLTEAPTIITDDGEENPLSFKATMSEDEWIKAISLKMKSMYFNSV